MRFKTKYPSQSKISLLIDSFEKGLNCLKDESKTNITSAYNLYNFDFSSGVLKPGIGFEDFLGSLCSGDELFALKQDINNIGNIERVYYFSRFDKTNNLKDDKLIIINSELNLYYINLFSSTKLLLSLRGVNFTSCPVAVQYRLDDNDVIIFSSETDNMLVWDGVNDAYQVLDAPKISSMTLYFERLFATVNGEKNSVWFSDDLDPTNWSVGLDEAGYIELIDERGALLKVVSFLNYVYIFRDYGISRLYAIGNQANFSVSNLFVSSGKIYPSSVCVCGDKILFLAQDGLYRFDGVDTVKILPEIFEKISEVDNSKCVSCYFNGSYYLACKYKFDNENIAPFYTNNTIIEINVNTMKLKNITHDVDVKFIISLNNNIDSIVALARLNANSPYTLTKLNKSAKFLNSNLIKVWQSPKNLLSYLDKTKYLSKIYIKSDYDISLTINSESNEFLYQFKGSNKTSTKRVCIPINEFSYKISSSNENCKIYNLKFEFDVTDLRR